MPIRNGNQKKKTEKRNQKKRKFRYKGGLILVPSLLIRNRNPKQESGKGNRKKENRKTEKGN